MSGALCRYQFLQTLIKLAVARSIPLETDDVSDAVEKLMSERMARFLPADAKIDPNAFRDDKLYTLEVEGVLRTHLRSLHALFEAFAGAGPAGRADLMSLPEWLSLLWHYDLFDDDFTPKEGTLAFQWSMTRVVDESKARPRLLNISLIDFFEALLRVAWRKRLPTPDMVRKAGKRNAGDYYLQLRSSPPDVYNSYLDAHTRAGLLSGDPVGMPAHVAVETLISVLVMSTRAVESNASGTADLMDEEVRSYMEEFEKKAASR